MHVLLHYTKATSFLKDYIVSHLHQEQENSFIRHAGRHKPNSQENLCLTYSPPVAHGRSGGGGGKFS